jgi:hypothetical protein
MSAQIAAGNLRQIKNAKPGKGRTPLLAGSLLSA